MLSLLRYVPRWFLLSCPFIGMGTIAVLSQSSPESAKNQGRYRGVANTALASTPESQDAGNEAGLPALPKELPTIADDDGFIYVQTQDGIRRRTTLDPALQGGLDQFIRQNGNPIAAIVVAEAKTGKILAMAHGRQDEVLERFGQHTALYSGFPAASIFKNVTTASSLEIAEVHEDDAIGLVGGCSDVHTRGVWLNDARSNERDPMTLRRAYGQSCNGFYAKLAVNYAGLNSVLSYAKRFGWSRQLPTDFALAPSPLLAPNPTGSSIHTVGRFAAGFGPVGLSAAHGAWFSVAMANDGEVKPLSIFADTPAMDTTAFEPLYSPEVGKVFRDIMSRTTTKGTATATFRKRPYRHLAGLVGGKTGTLTGDAPRGLTTWFTGMMPLNDPQIVVAAVVVVGDRWLFKGTQLAAEGFRRWNELHQKNITLSGTVNTNANSNRKLR